MTASYVQPCQEALTAFVNEGIVEAAILCTVDGLPIAHSSRLELASDAASAMSASLLALADAIIGQTGDADARCHQVVVESKNRTVAVIHAGDNMVLAVVGKAGINLGMVLGHANLTAERIVAIVSGSEDRAEIEQHEAPKRASLEELVQKVLREAQENRNKEDET